MHRGGRSARRPPTPLATYSRVVFPRGGGGTRDASAQGPGARGVLAGEYLSVSAPNGRTDGDVILARPGVIAAELPAEVLGPPEPVHLRRVEEVHAFAHALVEHLPRSIAPKARGDTGRRLIGWKP